MKNQLQTIVLILLCGLLSAAFLAAADDMCLGPIEPNTAAQDMPAVKAAVIVCKDMIDDGLYKSIRRRTQIALDEGAGYLIYMGICILCSSKMSLSPTKLAETTKGNSLRKMYLQAAFVSHNMWLNCHMIAALSVVGMVP